jgi:hypothetical protein
MRDAGGEVNFPYWRKLDAVRQDYFKINAVLPVFLRPAAKDIPSLGFRGIITFVPFAVIPI